MWKEYPAFTTLAGNLQPVFITQNSRGMIGLGMDVW